MTYPRSHLVDPNGGVYHVYSRCVRRAFLIGTNLDTGANFDHRRQWIEDRLLLLSNIFSIDIFGYAVMSNHYHLVLRVRPEISESWSDDEIIDKWLVLNPRKNETVSTKKLRSKALLSDKPRLTELRLRLGSLSWFMRYLNEPLARLANREDECTGRFWEGRFKCQRLLDERAIIECMIYVDLNPVRAGKVKSLLDSKHTSFAYRTNNYSRDDMAMKVINKSNEDLPFNYSLQEYFAMLNWTAHAQAGIRPGGHIATIDTRLKLNHFSLGLNRWQRALGSAHSLKNYAIELGQRWIRTYSDQVAS